MKMFSQQQDIFYEDEESEPQNILLIKNNVNCFPESQIDKDNHNDQINFSTQLSVQEKSRKDSKMFGDDKKLDQNLLIKENCDQQNEGITKKNYNRWTNEEKIIYWLALMEIILQNPFNVISWENIKIDTFFIKMEQKFKKSKIKNKRTNKLIKSFDQRMQKQYIKKGMSITEAIIFNLQKNIQYLSQSRKKQLQYFIERNKQEYANNTQQVQNQEQQKMSSEQQNQVTQKLQQHLKQNQQLLKLTNKFEILNEEAQNEGKQIKQLHNRLFSYKNQ